VKISSCEIIAHYKDSQRIDLITRGGRYLYLRANSQNERQKWLVAFGSTKQADMEFSVSRRSDIIKTRMVDLHSSCQILVSHIGSLKTIATTDKPLDHKVIRRCVLLVIVSLAIGWFETAAVRDL
jgi:pleckstrin family protein A (phosphoinositide binding specific) protein 8